MQNQVPKSFRPGMSNAFYFIRNALYKKVKQYAPELNGRLLDFGCGSKPYQSLFVNVAEYIGVDYNSEGHSHANETIDFFMMEKLFPFGMGILIVYSAAKYLSIFLIWKKYFRK